MVFGIMIYDKELSQRFHQIIEQHKGILFKVVRTYCKNDEDRQDLMQEVFIQVWKSLNRYDDNFAITTWLYRISLNVAISFYRKNAKRNYTRITLIEEHITTIQEPVNTGQQEQLNLLEVFISELNDLDKALMLLYLEDKSHSEISKIMGLSVSNVGTKVGRIKEKLKIKFSQVNS